MITIANYGSIGDNLSASGDADSDAYGDADGDSDGHSEQNLRICTNELKVSGLHTFPGELVT